MISIEAQGPVMALKMVLLNRTVSCASTVVQSLTEHSCNACFLLLSTCMKETFVLTSHLTVSLPHR